MKVGISLLSGVGIGISLSFEGGNRDVCFFLEETAWQSRSSD